MDDEDFLSDVYEILDFIHRYIRENGRRPTKEDIRENLGAEYEEDIEDLEKADYIEEYSRLRYDLTGNGAEFLRNSQLNERLERSIEQERLSSSAETIFTVSIIFSAWIQTSVAISRILSSENLQIGGCSLPLTEAHAAILLVSILFILGAFTAVQLTWDNLREVFSERTTLGKIFSKLSG